MDTYESKRNLMGLLTLVAGYRAGKRRQERRAAQQLRKVADTANEQCASCGYTRAQHSDTGRCPSY